MTWRVCSTSSTEPGAYYLQNIFVWLVGTGNFPTKFQLKLKLNCGSVAAWLGRAQHFKFEQLMILSCK